MKCFGNGGPVLMRKGGMVGPGFQKWGPGGACIHTSGNYFDVGGPGSGPRPDIGTVVDPNTIKLTFTDCLALDGVDPYGIAVFLSDDNGQSWDSTAVNVSLVSPAMTITVVPAIGIGDLVRVTYTGPGLVDCEDSEPLEDFDVPIDNPQVFADAYILLETGGADIVLIEDDEDDTAGIELEDSD